MDRPVWKDVIDIIYAVLAFVVRACGITSGPDDPLSLWNSFSGRSFVAQILQILVQCQLSCILLYERDQLATNPITSSMMTKRGNPFVPYNGSQATKIVANYHGLHLSAMQTAVTSAFISDHPRLWC